MDWNWFWPALSLMYFVAYAIRKRHQIMDLQEQLQHSQSWGQRGH